MKAPHISERPSGGESLRNCRLALPANPTARLEARVALAYRNKAKRHGVATITPNKNPGNGDHFYPGVLRGLGKG